MSTTTTYTNTNTNTTCLKCISIRQSCKAKTTCKKCKDAIKDEKKRAGIKALKETVKTHPTRLLKETERDHWTEEAIRTAVTAMPSIALDVKRIYPETRCYIRHEEHTRASIIVFLNMQNDVHLETIYASRRPGVIQYLYNKACDYVSSVDSDLDYAMRHGYTRPPQVYEDECMKYPQWLEAVQKHPGILQFCPMRYRTYELCLAAMNSNIHEVATMYNSNGENFPLKHVPHEHLTEEMCLAATTWCNRALWWWPHYHRNTSMYIRAVSANPSVLITTLPSEYINCPEIIAAAGPLSPRDASMLQRLQEYEATRPVVQKQERLPLYTEYNPTEEDVKEELGCPICTEEFTLNEKGVISLACKHVIHKTCIDKWLPYKHNCPVCRQSVYKKNKQ